MNTIGNDVRIQCKKCGGKAVVHTGMVYTSDPPMFSVDCSHCGRYYIKCTEL